MTTATPPSSSPPPLGIVSNLRFRSHNVSVGSILGYVPTRDSDFPALWMPGPETKSPAPESDRPGLASAIALVLAWAPLQVWVWDNLGRGPAPRFTVLRGNRILYALHQFVYHGLQLRTPDCSALDGKTFDTMKPGIQRRLLGLNVTVQVVNLDSRQALSPGQWCNRSISPEEDQAFRTEVLQGIENLVG